MWFRTSTHARLSHCLKHISSFKRMRMKPETCCRGFRSTSAASLWGTKDIFGFKKQTQSIQSAMHDGKSVVDRFIFTKTLTNFYDDCSEGIVLDTSYADSRPNCDWSKSVPVVVVLHDTPGCHKDLLPTLNIFAKLGCRVIAPSFPGHGRTQGLMTVYDSYFTQSSVERAMFVQDFLGNLGIQRVDLIIGYGAASYTVLYLVANVEEGFYRSFSLVSPWPMTRPRYDQDNKISRIIQDLWDRPLIRTPVTLGLQAVSLGNGKYTNEKVNTAFVINNLDLSEAGGNAMTLRESKIPRLVIYGGNDSGASRDEYVNTCTELNIPEENITKFKEKKLLAPLLPGALEFPDAGYDLQKQHGGLISLYMLHLVKMFHPQIEIL